ncbi:MAG: hypothetical protein K6C95_06790 [Lachnospiraceae bacterium]|nr:hypothetical protein [Lachnospiraceae bacterium]
MANEVNAPKNRVTRKHLREEIKTIRNDAQKTENNYTDAYKQLTNKAYRMAERVAGVHLPKKDKQKELQSDFLTDLKTMLETIRDYAGKEGLDDNLQLEEIERINRRLLRMDTAFSSTNLSSDQGISTEYIELKQMFDDIHEKVLSKFTTRTYANSNEKAQNSPLQFLNDLVKQDPRHSDYHGISTLKTLMGLPYEQIQLDQQQQIVQGYENRLNAQAAMGNTIHRFAEKICSFYTLDETTKATKNLSREDLAGLKESYDDLITKITEYKNLLPENHSYLEVLTRASVDLVKERTQVEQAIRAIDDNVRSNEELKREIRPFSIYEVQGRINPDFSNGFFERAHKVQNTGSAFRAKLTQWKQDSATKAMLEDFDETMAAFNKLTDQTLPQLLSLDRGDKGYLPAMTAQELSDLRDDYQNAVIKIDQFAKTYGEKPRSEEQKEFMRAISGVYLEMVDKFRMLDQLAGAEDVKELPEALDIQNAKKDELEGKEPPKKEEEKKALEEAEQELSEEQQRLKDAGFYQMLLNDGQLFPQMLFEPTDSQRATDLIGLKRESQALEGPRKNFNQIMTRNRRMRACPDISTFDTALAVNPDYPILTEEDKLGFESHFQELQKQAIDLAGKLTTYYEPDINGRTRLLNAAEIAEMEQAYRNLATEAFMCEGWLPKNDPRKAAFSALEELCDNHVKSFRAAIDYIERNAPEYQEARKTDENGNELPVVPRTKAFSLYELQGGMNPEIDGGALETVTQFKEELDAFESTLNKVSNKEFGQFKPIRAEYHAFAREINNLYNKVIPDMLRMDFDKGDFSSPVTRQKVQDAIKEFEKATMAFIPMRVDYERRQKKNNPKITEEEKKMFQTAAVLFQKVSDKWLAMNYLLDRKGNEIAQDIERHNTELDEFRQELKQYKDNQQLPENERKKDLKFKHDAKFLAWATQLDDLYMNKRLSPAALFEEDPSVGRSQILSELRLTEQNINDVQMRAFYLGEQPWKTDGTRDLGNLAEFQAHLAQRNEFGTHTVKQYATKGQTSSQEILEKAIRNMPDKLKKLQVTYLDEVVEYIDEVEEPRQQEIPQVNEAGREEQPKQEENIQDNQPKQEVPLNNQPVQAAPKPKRKRVTRQVERKGTVEEALRSFYNRNTKGKFNHKDEDLMLEIRNDDIRDYETKGFAKAFKRETLQDNRPLMYFVCDLNRALFNAGCNYDVYDLHTDNRIPNGYNRGYAKIAAQAINDDFAFVKSPENKKGTMVFTERKDKQGNQPSDNLLPRTNLWDGQKFQFGEAKQDQSFDVVIASTEKDYAEQVPGDKTKEFYTTTKNFRSSSFVGFLPTSVVQAPDFSNMTAKEMAMVMDDIEEIQYNVSAEKNKAADPFTSKVDDFSSYEKANTLANAADLQVMGYILGIPKYTSDKLRIGFKLNEKGKPEVSNILGAESDEDLFSNLAPNDPALVDPDNMLVMTSDMAQKILDWSEGKFNPNHDAVMASLSRLPDGARAAFDRRLKVMAAKVREAYLYNDDFDDVVDAEKKPGEPGMIGLHVKKGVIRILNRNDFNQLKLDDLSVGRNSGDYRTRFSKPPENIFDAVADLPKQSHLALMDKWAATWSGDKSKEYGHLPESRLGQSQYRKFIHESKFEREYTEKERERSLLKLKRMTGDIVRMDRNRKKESIFHWDTGKYTDVLKAQEELDREISKYADLHVSKTKDEYQKHFKYAREQLKENENYTELYEKARKENLEIKKQRDKIKAENEKEPDQKKHKPLPPFKPYPKKKIVSIYDLDPSAVRRINDYRDLRGVRDAMLKMRKKLEIYLTARVNPSSEFGQMRYDAMLKMYNDLNDRLAEYITYTGDLKEVPKTARLEKLPAKKGDEKVKYKVVFEPMMDSGEWELRIPEHVREDYIHAEREEIFEKGEKKNKDMAMIRAEADMTEQVIRQRYETAKKDYDLNGPKKQNAFLDGFEIWDNNDAVIKNAKKLNPRRLRPVLLNDPKKKKAPAAPKISVEDQRRQAKAEYEKLLKGGKEKSGFDFATMKMVKPEPVVQAQPAKDAKNAGNIVNPPEQKNIVNPNVQNNGTKSLVQDLDFNQMMAKELNKNKNNNNKINNGQKNNEQIIIEDKKEDKIIIEKKEDNIINEKKEDGKEQKKGQVNTIDFDQMFGSLITENMNDKKEIHRTEPVKVNEIDPNQKKNNGPITNLH